MIDDNITLPIPYHGDKVEVYRNLHKNCFSVRRKGKVIGYIEDSGIHTRDVEVYLTNVKFVVQPAGRRRVLKERRKNVHAFVRGTVTPFGGLQRKGLRRKCRRKVTYNPYKMDTFQDENGNAIYEAENVIISKGVVYV